MLDLDIIYLSDLKEHLPYKSTRSIVTWLIKHNVEIHGGKSCKRKFVFKLDFERRQLEDKIGFLIDRHGKDWINVIQAEMKIYSHYKAILEEKQVQQEIPSITKPNKSLGPQGSKFLKDIHSEGLHNL